MKITLAPGEEKAISKGGYNFFIKESDSPVEVTLKALDGQELQTAVLEAGQGIGGEDLFNTFTLSNPSAQAQTVVIYIGPRTFYNNRIAGQVTIKDTVEIEGAAARLATLIDALNDNSADLELSVESLLPVLNAVSDKLTAADDLAKRSSPNTVAVNVHDLDGEQKILSQNAGRLSARIAVVSGELYLGPASGVTEASGFYLGAQGEHTVNGSFELWASGTAKVQVIEESFV